MEYDIYKEMYNIELEILEHLKKTLKKNLDESGGNFRIFEASCIKNIEEYSRKNRKLTDKQFKTLNKEIRKVIKKAFQQGANSEEFNILSQIQNGYVPPVATGITVGAGFFKLNENKINMLRDEALAISNNCRIAILRTTDDIYRQIIFEAATYDTLGFSTWESVDRAVQKFTAQGIKGIKFANGAEWNVAAYAEMALRTASKRATNFGEGAVREEYGINTVVISTYGACSAVCLPWQGKIYYDNIYTSLPVKDNKYPLLSTAITGGLFHPNCRHTMSTFYEGISEIPKKYKSDRETLEHSQAEQKQRYYERKIRESKRQQQMALTQQSKRKYKERTRKYEQKLNDHIADVNITYQKDVLRRDKEREKLR